MTAAEQLELAKSHLERVKDAWFEPTDWYDLSLSSHESPVQRLELICRWPSLKAKRWVETFVQTACSDPSLAAVVLLGSLVRPVKQVNDVDVLYIYKEKATQCPGRSIDVDLRAYSQEDVRSLLTEGNDLLGWAIRFGYLLCEKDFYWTHLREEWLDRLPLPDPEVAKERARKADAMYRTLQEMGDIDAAKEQLLSRLTHEARSMLLSSGIYPRSRPELPEQLNEIGEHELARSLNQALVERDETESAHS